MPLSYRLKCMTSAFALVAIASIFSPVRAAAVLYNFGANSTDAMDPSGALALLSASHFCGVTDQGGSQGEGTLYCLGSGAGDGIVYSLTPPAAGQTGWKFAVIHDFGLAPSEGMYPQGGLVRDAAGNLYGTTEYTSPGIAPVTYRPTPGAGQANWTETILQRGKANTAFGGLALGSNGNFLLGTTFKTTIGGGTVYRLSLP